MDSGKCLNCGYPVIYDSLGGICIKCAGKIIKDYDSVIIKLKLVEDELKVERERSLMLLSELRKLSKSKKNNNKELHKLSTKDNDELIKKLGSDYDTELAIQFNVHNSTVCRLRNQYNVPVYDPSQDLWIEIDPIIFDMPIRKIAKQFGVGRGKIESRRKKLIKIKKDYLSKEFI